MAYFIVHYRAVSSYLFLSCLYWCAISGTSGSSGFGSVSSEHIDNKTLDIVKAGDQFSFKISKHILPLLFIFG